MDNVEYTSNVLCHFVGRSLTTEDAQYNLLLKILTQDHTLYPDAKNPNKTNPSAKLDMNYTGENQGELFTSCPCVCFCDIPIHSLAIHCNKYSYFGLGFAKSFLIAQGARPVLYIPKSHKMQGFVDIDTPKSPNDYYITFMHKIPALNNLLGLLNGERPFKIQLEKILQTRPYLRETVEQYAVKPIAKELNEGKLIKLLSQINGAWMTQCAYVKVFDDTLAADDPNNFYMEREWRCLNNVNFSPQDVDTIFLPEHYANRFANDVPEYQGKVHPFQLTNE